MKNIFGLILLLSGFSISIQAQISSENGAFSAGNGILIFLSDNTYNDAKPNKNVTAIRIERKAETDAGFTTLATVSSPADGADFERRFNTAMANLPYDLPQLKGKGKSIWEKYARYNRFDSLRVTGAYLPVQLAFGIAYLDQSAKPGIHYTYQLTYLEGGKTGKTLAFTPTSYPKKTVFGQIQFISNTYEGHSLEFKCGGKKGSWPQNLIALRQDKLVGNWERLSTPISRNTGKDSIFVYFRDTTVTEKRVYRYALVPSDAYGNPGDTIFSNYVGAYEYIQVAPVFLHIVSGLTPDKSAVTISWIIEDASLVSAVRIFKSADREGKYDTLATVPANTATYVDQNTSQLKMTYYFLQCLGPLGEAGPHGSRFFALPDQDYTPLPPTLISATPGDKGISLLIQNNEKNVTGFRIYRQEDNDLPMLSISDLITIKEDNFTYTDTSSSLAAARQYGYCVKSESPGHTLSPASDTLYARLTSTIPPPMPTGLGAKPDDKVVKLFWDNMTLIDENISAYRIYRKELPNGKWEGLNDSILLAVQNNFVDTRISEGKSYAYSVESFDYFGGKSGQGTSIEVSVPLPLIEAPAGMKAWKSDEGIQVTCDITLQDNLKSYNLYRYERGKAPKIIATISASETVQYTDTQVSAGSLYFYYFTCSAADGRESLAGEEVSVRY